MTVNCLCTGLYLNCMLPFYLYTSHIACNNVVIIGNNIDFAIFIFIFRRIGIEANILAY